jgi:hypothetical protein
MAYINEPEFFKDLTPLEIRAHRMNDVYCIDLKWHFINLFDHPENEWFLTDNKAFTDNYDICMKLYEMNLIAKKEEPIYRNGSYCGNKVYFKYDKQLKF